ncbi:hypothetical protein C922_04531 [Plasmodium inui San Antonio 1]|uniref:Protein phosphatase 1 regulatory subunit 21 N-terminal domain-containing protein n=1 Tax=Plasmodium inui San Antonio 1 TaxID=1237626 RepID=W7A0F2_9APIC|nr:hypothetical protein C922_04531 [Plasmodium inui San Antonio 1]EUD65020.1 hypothetical protein C922_04531 [Plasmodium inui San Antonio 1]
MNVEEKYKLFKEKYKEIKEQNDILKKAIVEYKKDIKQLEKDNEEQKDKISRMVDENNDLLSSNSQLSSKVAQLASSLEDKKKGNSGWRNLMLLPKNSRENIEESVAFEELENKIKENEMLHKKVEDLQNENKKIEEELDACRTFHKDKLNERERTIDSLNEIITNSSRSVIRLEQERDEMRQQLEEDKGNFARVIENKNEHIKKMEKIYKSMRRKCYPKYKVNFNRIPLSARPDHYDGYLQRQINEHCKLLQSHILNAIQKLQQYLLSCKNTFASQANQLIDFCHKTEGEQKGEKKDDQLDYSRVADLKRISQKEVSCLEEAINLLDDLRTCLHGSKDKVHVQALLRNLATTVKKIFLNVSVYLCVEEYLFPTYTTSKSFSLKNVARELKRLKRLLLKAIHFFALLLFVTPYENEKIVEEHFKKRNVVKWVDETAEGEAESGKKGEQYHVEANYEEADTSLPDSEDDTVKSDQMVKLRGIHFKELLEEREKNSLSTYEHLKNCSEENKKLITYLGKKFHSLLEDFCHALKFLKSYFSFRIFEMKGSDVLHVDNSRVMTEMLDATESLINYLQTFDVVEKKSLPLIAFLSYQRFNTRMAFEEERNCLNRINEAFIQTRHIPYAVLESSFGNLQMCKKDKDQLNKALLRKTKLIKKLKRNCNQTLGELKNVLLTNKELTLNNQCLISCLPPKRETINHVGEDTTEEGIKKYAEMVFNFVSYSNLEKPGLTVHEKQLIEAYVCSCIRIKNLHMEIRKHVLESLQNGFTLKEGEIQKLNLQIEAQKEEEINIHKKYEEQMNTLHDLIITLEKQLSKLNSEKNVNKFLILCSICGSKNSIGKIGKVNRPIVRSSDHPVV